MHSFAQVFSAGVSSVMGGWFSIEADAERWSRPWENEDLCHVQSESCSPAWFVYGLSPFAMGARWAQDHFSEIVASLRAAGQPVPEDAVPNGWSDEGEVAFYSVFHDCVGYYADRDSDAPLCAPWSWNSDFSAWFDPRLSPHEMAEKWFAKCQSDIGDLSSDEEEDEEEEEAATEVDGIKLILPASMSEYYYQGPSDLEPWEAFFELHLSDEKPELSAGRQYGGGQPADVAAGRTLRFAFPADSSVRDVRACMREIAPLCATLAETWDTEWHGSNEVGVYDEDAKATVQEAVNDYFDRY